MRFALVAVLALAFAANANAFTKQDAKVTMDDGVQLATTLYLPDGPQPTAGWPGVIMLHGLGGDRLGMNVLAETYFVDQGYAVLTYDVRGHGDSGGFVTIAGPREIADLRALEAQFAARPDVDDLHIGAWGISYGGGQTWLGAVQGIPFAAIELCQTWTDLYTSLFPNGVPKSGIIGGLLNTIPAGKLSPDFSWVPDAAIRGTDLPALPRSPPSDRLAARLEPEHADADAPGPPRLRLRQHAGDSSLQPAERPEALVLRRPRARAVDVPRPRHRLRDDALAPVVRPLPEGAGERRRHRAEAEIAPDPWKGKPAGFQRWPLTTRVTYPLPGPARTLGWEAHLTRVAGRTATKLEDIGTPVVQVRATSTGGWSRLVAELVATTAPAKQIVVSGGAVRTSDGTHTYSFHLMSQITAIPAGSRLSVIFGSNTSSTPAGLLYLDLPTSARRRLTDRCGRRPAPLLRKPVS